MTDISTGGYMNESLTGDDGGYYDTTEFNTVIRVEDLQRDVSDKNAGEITHLNQSTRYFIPLHSNI